MQPLIKLLGVLTNSGLSEKVGGMYQYCVELFEEAKVAVDRCRVMDLSVKRNGGREDGGGRESVEDFIRRIESIISDDGIGSHHEAVEPGGGEWLVG